VQAPDDAAAVVAVVAVELDDPAPPAEVADEVEDEAAPPPDVTEVVGDEAPPPPDVAVDDMEPISLELELELGDGAAVVVGSRSTRIARPTLGLLVGVGIPPCREHVPSTFGLPSAGSEPVYVYAKKLQVERLSHLVMQDAMPSEF
jgi:hypothetical protein